MRNFILLLAFATLGACGSPPSKSPDEQKPAETIVGEPTSSPSPAEEQPPDLEETASASITKPVALLEPAELKAIEEMSNEILLTYFYGTRENGDINFWSSPQRREVIREGTQYATATETIYMYPSPDAILRVQDNRIIWKDPKNIPHLKLGAPITLNTYSFSLKAPVAQSKAYIIDGVNREMTLHYTDIDQSGKTYRLVEALVNVVEGTIAPDGSKLHEISIFPLTVSID